MAAMRRSVKGKSHVNPRTPRFKAVWGMSRGKKAATENGAPKSKAYLGLAFLFCRHFFHYDGISSSWPKRSSECHSPFTTHHSPLTTHHSPLTIHHSPFTIHYSLFTIHYSLFTIHYSLFTIHYSLFTIHGSRCTHASTGSPPNAPCSNRSIRRITACAPSSVST